MNMFKKTASLPVLVVLALVIGMLVTLMTAGCGGTDSRLGDSGNNPPQPIASDADALLVNRNDTLKLFINWARQTRAVRQGIPPLLLGSNDHVLSIVDEYLDETTGVWQDQPLPRSSRVILPDTKAMTFQVYFDDGTSPYPTTPIKVIRNSSGTSYLIISGVPNKPTKKLLIEEWLNIEATQSAKKRTIINLQLVPAGTAATATSISFGGDLGADTGNLYTLLQPGSTDSGWTWHQVLAASGLDYDLETSSDQGATKYKFGIWQDSLRQWTVACRVSLMLPTTATAFPTMKWLDATGTVVTGGATDSASLVAGGSITKPATNPLTIGNMGTHAMTFRQGPGMYQVEISLPTTGTTKTTDLTFELWSGEGVSVFGGSI